MPGFNLDLLCKLHRVTLPLQTSLSYATIHASHPPPSLFRLKAQWGKSCLITCLWSTEHNEALILDAEQALKKLNFLMVMWFPKQWMSTRKTERGKKLFGTLHPPSPNKVVIIIKADVCQVQSLRLLVETFPARLSYPLPVPDMYKNLTGPFAFQQAAKLFINHHSIWESPSIIVGRLHVCMNCQRRHRGGMPDFRFDGSISQISFSVKLKKRRKKKNPKCDRWEIYVITFTYVCIGLYFI